MPLEIPKDIRVVILSYAKTPTLCTWRLVSKECKNEVDLTLKKLCSILISSKPISVDIDLSKKMTGLILNEVEGSNEDMIPRALKAIDGTNNDQFFGLFKRLNLEFTKGRAFVPRWLIATRVSEFEDLRMGLLVYDVDLRAFFTRIVEKKQEEQNPIQFTGRPPTAAKEISDWFRDDQNAEILAQITTLDLSSLNLVLLPSEIAKLTRLEVLKLSGNNLKSLPDVLKDLTKLKTLNLSDNKFVILPEVLEECKELTVLNLANNRLIELPKEISALKNLEDLNLADNNLETLPDEMKDLTKLRFLDISANCFASKPEVIEHLPCNLVLEPVTSWE